MWNLAVVLLLCAAYGRSLPPSPCPDVYGYEKTHFGEVKGLIAMMAPPRYSDVQVVVMLSSPVPVSEGAVGDLSLKGGQAAAQEATREVLMGRRHILQFYITFPPGKPIPTLLSIKVNDKDFCVSQNAPANSRALITLHSFLSTGVSAPPTKDFGIVENIFPGSIQQSGQDMFTYFESEPSPPHLTTKDPPYNPFVTQFPTESTVRRTSTTTRRPTTIRPSTTTSAVVSFFEEDYSDDFEVDPYNCGVPEKAANTLVVHGVEAERGEWPWQIALFHNTNIESSPGIRFQCGGTLVTRRHIISAAHCVVEKRGSKLRKLPTSSLTVFLGKHNIRSWIEEGQQTFEVEQIIVHPGYNSNYNNDISILRLSSSVQITRFVKPICMWDRPTDLSDIEGQVASVPGWGKDETGSLSDKLRVAKMPIVSQETCLRSDSFYSTYTSENTLCAGYKNGTTVCNGDSGGGLSLSLRNPLQNRKTWYLRGVVSVSRLDTGDIACDIYNYVIFTDVAKHTSWLQQYLRNPA